MINKIWLQLIGLCVLCIFLTGCFYAKEAKKLKKDPEVQAEISRVIKELMLEEFDLDVKVDIKKLSFSHKENYLFFKFKTSERLEVPVEIIGKPSYRITAYFPIYDGAKDEYTFTGEKDVIKVSDIHKMRRKLLEDIYVTLYEAELNKIKEFNKKAYVSIDVFDKPYRRKGPGSNSEAVTLLQAFAADYQAGHFADEKMYLEMLNKYSRTPEEADEEVINKDGYHCTATVNIILDYGRKSNKIIEEELRSMMAFVANEATLPNAHYRVSANQKYDGEYIFVEDEVDVCR